MRRAPTPLRLLLLAAALLGCRASQAPDPAAPEAVKLTGAAQGRSVILLSVDTLRADRLGAWGYGKRETSPEIDALVGSGARFSRAMAQRATTWPSLASVLTGLYPSGHGVIQNGYEFPDDLLTLPKLLHAAGYQTAASLSNMCRANHQGWDAFKCSGGQDGKAIRWAQEWLQQRDPERPVFLWIHLFGAHPPYYNGGDRARQLDPDYDGPLGTKKWQLNRIMTQQIDLTSRDVEHLQAIYDAAVMGTDGLVGRTLRVLEEAGLGGEESLLVLLADHGEELYEHNGYIYHACSPYQTALHVPLSFVAPGLLDVTTIDSVVELIDVFPTVFDLLGLEVGERHGVSLVPYLERGRGAGAGRPAFSEYGATELHTVLQGPWKLIDNPEELSPICLQDAPEDHYPLARAELYNLADDPGETTNLAATEAARVAELQRLLASRFSALGERAGPQEIPEDLRAELEALGYIAD